MKLISKILTVVLITPSLVLAYVGVFGAQISGIQVISAVALLAMWFVYKPIHLQTHLNKI